MLHQHTHLLLMSGVALKWGRTDTTEDWGLESITETLKCICGYIKAIPCWLWSRECHWHKHHWPCSKVMGKCLWLESESAHYLRFFFQRSFGTNFKMSWNFPSQDFSPSLSRCCTSSNGVMHIALAKFVNWRPTAISDCRVKWKYVLCKTVGCLVCLRLNAHV